MIGSIATHPFSPTRAKRLFLLEHSAVHAAYGEQFAKTAILDPKYHRWLLDGSDKRLLGDYEVEATLDRDDVEKMITQAKEFLEVARRYLEPSKDATSKQT
jgi:uncharacterized protein (UPF0332 family)